jgi:hypothetical protein
LSVGEIRPGTPTSVLPPVTGMVYRDDAIDYGDSMSWVHDHAEYIRSNNLRQSLI